MEGVRGDGGDLLETGGVYAGDKVEGGPCELLVADGETPLGEGSHDLLDGHVREPILACHHVVDGDDGNDDSRVAVTWSLIGRVDKFIHSIDYPFRRPVFLEPPCPTQIPLKNRSERSLCLR